MLSLYVRRSTLQKILRVKLKGGEHLRHTFELSDPSPTFKREHLNSLVRAAAGILEYMGDERERQLHLLVTPMECVPTFKIELVKTSLFILLQHF